MEKYRMLIIALGVCAALAPCACRSSARKQDMPPRADAESSMHKTDIHPDEAKKLLEAREGYTYLDVRTPAEFEAGHAPGAINISFAEIDPSTGKMEARPEFLSETKSRLPRDAKLIVGCRSGVRSAKASDVLRREGYTNVLNMVGGFGGVTGPDGTVEQPGWTTLGYPVEKGSASPASEPKGR